MMNVLQTKGHLKRLTRREGAGLCARPSPAAGREIDGARIRQSRVRRIGAPAPRPPAQREGLDRPRAKGPAEAARHGEPMTLWLTNLAVFSVQLAVLVATSVTATWLFRVRQPRMSLTFWRALAVAGLLLPVIQPWSRDADGNIRSTALDSCGASGRHLPCSLLPALAKSDLATFGRSLARDSADHWRVVRTGTGRYVCGRSNPGADPAALKNEVRWAWGRVRGVPPCTGSSREKDRPPPRRPRPRVHERHRRGRGRGPRTLPQRRRTRVARVTERP